MKPLQKSGGKKLSAVQFSNTTGKRAASLRLLKTVSTVTVAHEEQQRIWKICMSNPSLPACADAPRERLSWNIYREQRENGQCEECLGKHKQNSSAVLFWGRITEPPSAPGAALALYPSLTQKCVSARGAGNLVIASTYCYDACGFIPLSSCILFPLIKLVYVLCFFLVILF